MNQITSISILNLCCKTVRQHVIRKGNKKYKNLMVKMDMGVLFMVVHN